MKTDVSASHRSLSRKKALQAIDLGRAGNGSSSATGRPNG
jgi:hypothetical protein